MSRPRKYLIFKIPAEIRGNETRVELLEAAGKRILNHALKNICELNNITSGPVEPIRDGEDGIVLRDQDKYAPFALYAYALGIDSKTLDAPVGAFMRDLAEQWEKHPNRKTPD